MFRSPIQSRLPDAVISVLILTDAGLLSGRLPGADLPLRLLLMIALPLLTAAAVRLSGVSGRNLRLLMAALTGILLLLRLL